MQFRRLQLKAPPPAPPEAVWGPLPGQTLPSNVQFSRSTCSAPPPELAAEFVAMMQFVTTARILELPQTPPPDLWTDIGSLSARVAPFRQVNPLKVAPLVSQAQRTASGPLVVVGSHAPRIKVTLGPFKLFTMSGLSTATRLVRFPP